MRETSQNVLQEQSGADRATRTYPHSFFDWNTEMHNPVYEAKRTWLLLVDPYNERSMVVRKSADQVSHRGSWPHARQVRESAEKTIVALRNSLIKSVQNGERALKDRIAASNRNVVYAIPD